MASASAAIAVPSIARGSLCRENSPSISAAWNGNFQRNAFARNLSFSPLSVRSPGSRGAPKIIAMATGDTTDPSEAVQDVLKSVQEAWDKTEDKLAISALGFAALIVLWASAGLVGAIDKLPLLPTFFELVGILFTGWFVYRYLLFKPDREELAKKVEVALSKITGTES